MGSDLSGVGLAQADDANATGDRCEAKHMQSAFERAYGNVTRLGVHLSAVHSDPRVREIEFRRSLEAQAALAEVALVLGWIEFDSHVLIVLTIRP
jgi:hypothetical protein